MNNSQIIGKQVEYISNGQTYQGKVLDCVRILGRGQDEGKAFDLYMIKVYGGRIYKVSPAAITKIIINENTF